MRSEHANHRMNMRTEGARYSADEVGDKAAVAIAALQRSRVPERVRPPEDVLAGIRVVGRLLPLSGVKVNLREADLRKTDLSDLPVRSGAPREAKLEGARLPLPSELSLISQLHGRVIRSRGYWRAIRLRLRGSAGRSAPLPWPPEISPRRSAGRRIAPDGIDRVGAWCVRKRPPKKINAPAGVTRRVTRVSAELRGAEVPRSSPPRREGPVVILGIEGPDVEVLDAIFPVHIVQGSALTQGPAEQPPGIPSGAGRMPSEELGLCVGGQRGEPKQVS